MSGRDQGRREGLKREGYMSDPLELRREAEAPVLATRDDLDEVVTTLADAFVDDLDMDWFIRADERRNSARRTLFARLIRGLAFRHGRIERPPSGGAAAVWMPFEWVRPDPLIDVLLDGFRLMPITGPFRAHRLIALRRSMDHHHPRGRPHAYLWFLGVAPAAQGHGVGSALLRSALARFDAEGMPTFLETNTDRNLALYRRHGYEVTGEHRAMRGAPIMWSMWREPEDALATGKAGRSPAERP
jgi:ribosomal protein S18 acetylase RimI-like enzyme